MIAEDVVPIEGEVFSPRSLSTDALVAAVVSSFSKIRDAMPYVFELRKRFADAPKGAADIAGCNTWEEFCQKHLHRTPRAIQMALQDMKAVPCELCGEMLESKNQLAKHKHKKHPEIAEAHRDNYNVHRDTYDAQRAELHRQQQANDPFTLRLEKLAQQDAEVKAALQFVKNTPDEEISDDWSPKGWHSWSARQKHDFGVGVGCGYCTNEKSARSCPAHGWPEKRRNRDGVSPTAFQDELLDVVEELTEEEARITLEFIRDVVRKTAVAA